MQIADGPTKIIILKLFTESMRQRKTDRKCFNGWNIWQMELLKPLRVGREL